MNPATGTALAERRRFGRVLGATPFGTAIAFLLLRRAPGGKTRPNRMSDVAARDVFRGQRGSDSKYGVKQA